ncbi:MAG: hypothetical protein KAJ49_03385 [Arcobacteraceae bacterium]|nr:hypothetical protein [Arcobacteraceae bacterium]
MKESKCLTCGEIFKSKTEKLKHKKAYPDGSCEKLKGELNNIPKIKLIPKEQAKEEWKKYVQVLKKRKDNYLQVMKKAMYQMKEGRELLDIYKVMKQAGLNENNEPKLAIARADLQEVYFEKRDTGTGIFGTGQEYNSISWNKDKVSLPDNTFDIHWERKGEWSIEKKIIKTKVPNVPIELLPEGDLSGYYILWETDEWKELPETKDPILLKRISENLFAILGTWDLTELEQSIIAGL